MTTYHRLTTPDDLEARAHAAAASIALPDPATGGLAKATIGGVPWAAWLAPVEAVRA